MLKRLWRDDTGQDVAEYAMMLGVILVVVVTAVMTIGSKASSIFELVGTKLGEAGAPAN